MTGGLHRLFGLAFVVLQALVTDVNGEPNSSTDPCPPPPKPTHNPDANGFMKAMTYISLGGHATCTKGLIEVTIPTARLQNGIVITKAEPKDQFEVVEYFQQFLFENEKFTNESRRDVKGDETVYKIFGELCVPKKHPEKGRPTGVQYDKNGPAFPILEMPLQILVHGLGFTHEYWHFDTEHSWIDQSAAQGFSTFSFDRLGTGRSDAPPAGLTSVQADIQMRIVERLAEMFKAGKIGAKPFKRLVGIGHGIGSASLVAATAEKLCPELFDGLVLTGWTPESKYPWKEFMLPNLKVANSKMQDGGKSKRSMQGKMPKIEPSCYDKLSASYLISDGLAANSFLNFRGDYKQGVAKDAEQRKGSIAMGELFTMDRLPKRSEGFKGYLYVVIGSLDIPFGRRGLTEYDLALFMNDVFPSNEMRWSEQTFSEIVAGSGHALNLHESGGTTAKKVNRWLFDNLCGMMRLGKNNGTQPASGKILSNNTEISNT